MKRDLSDEECRVLGALLATGDCQKAAKVLDIDVSVVRNYLNVAEFADLYSQTMDHLEERARELGYVNYAQWIEEYSHRSEIKSPPKRFDKVNSVTLAPTNPEFGRFVGKTLDKAGITALIRMETDDYLQPVAVAGYACMNANSTSIDTRSEQDELILVANIQYSSKAKYEDFLYLPTSKIPALHRVFLSIDPTNNENIAEFASYFGLLDYLPTFLRR